MRAKKVADGISDHWFGVRTPRGYSYEFDEISELEAQRKVALFRMRDGSLSLISGLEHGEVVDGAGDFVQLKMGDGSNYTGWPVTMIWRDVRLSDVESVVETHGRPPSSLHDLSAELLARVLSNHLGVERKDVSFDVIDKTFTFRLDQNDVDRLSRRLRDETA